MNKMKLRGVLLAVAGTFAVCAATPAIADSSNDIIYTLMAKGILTEEEGHKLLEGRETEKKAAEKANKDNATVKMGKKGLQVASGDGNFTMNIGGRLHADWTYHDGDNNLFDADGDPTEATDGTDVRRARMAISGNIMKDFHYMIEADFGGDNVAMKDVFLAYKGIKGYELTAGHQKHAMSMEVQESSNDIMFTERSLVSALSVPYFDRAIGLNAKTMGKNWNVQGGVYGDAMTRNTSNDREGSGWAIRGTIAPINTDSSVIHLGANFGQRQTNSEGEANSITSPARFRYETTNMSDLYLIDTNTLGMDKINLGVLELAGMSGPFSVQSEFAKAKVERDAGSDLDFNAFYVQAGWTLTGESRTYKATDGEFKRLKPRNPFSLSKGTWGAWELAARYDQIDLNDNNMPTLGGEAKRATLALNWYLNENVRLMADWMRSFDLDNSPIRTASGGEPDSIDVLNMRVQWAF